MHCARSSETTHKNAVSRQNPLYHTTLDVPSRRQKSQSHKHFRIAPEPIIQHKHSEGASKSPTRSRYEIQEMQVARNNTGQSSSGTHLNVASAEGCLDRGKRVPPDGQKEEDVNDYQPYGVRRGAIRVHVGHLGLDQESQEVAEKNHQTTLFATHRSGFDRDSEGSQNHRHVMRFQTC